MQIVVIPIDNLTPYEKNAKIHTPEQIKQIKTSIKKFGMNDPIGIWGDRNIIIEGHGRWLALKELGYTEVDCIRLDHLTDKERKAYGLAHNKLTMNTDFDFNLLSEELNALDDFNMSEFGFDDFVTDDDFGTDFELEDGEKQPIQQMTFTLHDNQADVVSSAVDYVLSNDLIGETFGNENKKGNALYEVVREWVELKNLS